jgi:hypothetical protein
VRHAAGFFSIALGSTSFGRFGRTGAFRISGEYSLSWNHSIPSYTRTEREDGLQEWNRDIPFQQILQPNTPLVKEPDAFV